MEILKLVFLASVTAVTNVCGQNLGCNDSNLVGFNESEGNDITTTYCEPGSNLELCPPMEIVTQTIGVDNPVVFVTCRVQEGASVSVRAECSCGMEFESKSERCSNSSTASPGLIIVYVTPEINNNLQVTAYIENFNLTDNRTILIQCIVRNASLIDDNNITGIFNATIQYKTSGDNDISIASTDETSGDNDISIASTDEPSVPEEPSGAERLLMETESPLFIIATFFSILLSI